MSVDIIIPTYKPGRELLELLDRLEEQTLPADNIILMNTEERYFRQLTEGIKFEERYPKVKVFHLSKREFDHGGTRHRAVQHSRGDIFVMLTQDAMPVDRRLVETLVGGLAETSGKKVAAAYARQLPGPDAPEYEKISRAFNYPEKPRVKTAADVETMGIKAFFCSNVCAAYRRDIYEELGGFIRHTIFNEDMIYAAGALRAGYAVAYTPQARVVHSHNYTNLMQFRRNFDLGVSQADHPEIFQAAASESEGRRLVKAAWEHLQRRRQLYLFPGFCVQCGCRYAGYLLGKHYKILPRNIRLSITTNKEYWGKED